MRLDDDPSAIPLPRESVAVAGVFHAYTREGRVCPQSP
jgi:hypothetical protein